MLLLPCSLQIFYGMSKMAFNIHGLNHLPSDGLAHGMLDTFSCPCMKIWCDLWSIAFMALSIQHNSYIVDFVNGSSLSDSQHCRKWTSPVIPCRASGDVKILSSSEGWFWYLRCRTTLSLLLAGGLHKCHNQWWNKSAIFPESHRLLHYAFVLHVFVYILCW